MPEKNYEPFITSFSITVEIPVDAPIALLSCKDIFSWEKTFLIKRNNAQILSEKKSFDVCHATLQWASACGATLDKITKGDNSVEFTFKFTDLEKMLNFKTYLKSKVKDLTIY